MSGGEAPVGAAGEAMATARDPDVRGHGPRERERLVGHAAAGRELPREAGRFARTFRAAGLPVPRLDRHTEVGVGAEASLLPYLAPTLRDLLSPSTRGWAHSPPRTPRWSR